MGDFSRLKLQRQLDRGLNFFVKNNGLLQDQQEKILRRTFNEEVLKPLNRGLLDEIERNESPEDQQRINSILLQFDGNVIDRS